MEYGPPCRYQQRGEQDPCQPLPSRRRGPYRLRTDDFVPLLVLRDFPLWRRGGGERNHSYQNDIVRMICDAGPWGIQLTQANITLSTCRTPTLCITVAA